MFQGWNRCQTIFTVRGNVYWWGVRNRCAESFGLTLGRNVERISMAVPVERPQIIKPETEGVEWIVPVWAIAIPSTLSSAWLLLRNSARNTWRISEG
jgi:hypothetical protein